MELRILRIEVRKGLSILGVLLGSKADCETTSRTLTVRECHLSRRLVAVFLEVQVIREVQSIVGRHRGGDSKRVGKTVPVLGNSKAKRQGHPSYRCSTFQI